MKKKILIIDDKETIAKIISMYLGNAYELIWFDNAIKALAWLHEGNTPDLIITDLKMPEMRGEEFLEKVKSSPLFKHIPVVILSSEDSTSDRIRLLEAGAEDYIVKPFNPVELNLRVKKILS